MANAFQSKFDEYAVVGDTISATVRGFEVVARIEYDDYQDGEPDVEYVGVVLSVSRKGIVLKKYAASLWGIESDSGDYFNEVANELFSEALEAADEIVSNLCDSGE